MKSIWNEISVFNVCKGGDELSFVQRLARENAWSQGYAQRIYQEYLKFIYLAATSDRSVTPSDDVDQAWHLHLCYSDSYWNDLCKDILGRPLHHGPTKGGEDENVRFRQQYEETLDCYAKEFSVDAPEDIWPSADIRFNGKNQFVRLNRNDVFVVKKKNAFLLGGAALTTLLFSSCGNLIDGAMDGELKSILIVVALFLVARFILKKIFGSGGGGGRGGSAGGGFFSSGCSNDSGCSSGCGGGCGA